MLAKHINHKLQKMYFFYSFPVRLNNIVGLKVIVSICVLCPLTPHNGPIGLISTSYWQSSVEATEVAKSSNPPLLRLHLGDLYCWNCTWTKYFKAWLIFLGVQILITTLLHHCIALHDADGKWALASQIKIGVANFSPVLPENLHFSWQIETEYFPAGTCLFRLWNLPQLVLISRHVYLSMLDWFKAGRLAGCVKALKHWWLIHFQLDERLTDGRGLHQVFVEIRLEQQQQMQAFFAHVSLLCQVSSLKWKFSGLGLLRTERNQVLPRQLSQTRVPLYNRPPRPPSDIRNANKVAREIFEKKFKEIWWGNFQSKNLQK